MFRIIVILLLTLCSFFSAKAGLDSARFVHFDISNGLPSNNVYSLVTDIYGYTWFATDKGVAKYNGYTFTTYNTSNGLPSDDAWELMPDKTGRVWVYSFGYRFGYIKDGIYNELKLKTKRLIYAYYICEAGDATYFLIGDDKEDDLVFLVGGIVKVFPFDRSTGIQRDHGVIDNYLGNGLALYVMDSAERIYKWDILKGDKNYEFVFKADEPLKYGYRYRRSMSPYMEQYSFRFNDQILYRHNFEKKLIDKPMTLAGMGADADEHIYAFNPYYLRGNQNPNSTLITNSHMYTVSKGFKLLERVAIREVVPTNAQLAYYYIDRTGSEWFTTKDDGVWMKPKANPIFSSLKLSAILSGCVFTGIVGSKSYWWSRRDLTLYIIEKNELSGQIVFPAGSSIRSVTGAKGEIFIGGESGIYHYSEEPHSLRPLQDHYKTRFKIEGKETQHKAILRNRKSAFEFVNLIKEVDGNIYSSGADYALMHNIKDDSVITEIKYSERFIGIQAGGSVRIFYNNQKLIINNTARNSEVAFDVDELRSLGLNNIRQIEKDSFDNWYLLGDERLFVCNAGTKYFKQVNLNVSIRDAQLKIVGNDMILAGKFGIGHARITGPGAPGDMRVTTNFSAGISYYNQVKSLCVSGDGYVIVQTDNGVFDFTLQELRATPRFNVSKGNFFKLMLHSPYEKQVKGNDTFAVEQEDQKIVLDVISYYGKGAVNYFYKTRRDAQWQESGAGEIFIGNLAAGKYHKILCKAKDDLWESKVYAIYVYRYPMWWQTEKWQTVFWVAGFVLFLGLVLLTALITKYFVAKKNERRRALTNLELQAIHSQINPHFIFNSLSAALFYISRKRFDDAYTHVNKFSQLLRSYLKSSHDRYVILEEEIKMLRNYIELQQIRFEEKFEYRIEIDNKLPINNVRIPSLLLQPLVENAINHGLFHREKGGILLLKFEQGADNTVLVCTIDDNGVGRAAARKINDTTSTRDSYGTKLTNQLLEVFKLYEKLDIKLDYTDKVLPETGTVVTLTLKNIKYVA